MYASQLHIYQYKLVFLNSTVLFKSNWLQLAMVSKGTTQH